MRRILIFLKKSIQLFKNYSLIGLFVDGNVYKTTNKSPMIHTNQILLCSNWPELSPSSFTHIFKTIETTTVWGEIACQKRFVFYRWRPNIKIFLFYSISNDINFVPKYLDNALTDSILTSRTSSRLLEEKAPVNDFVRTVPGEKYCSKYNRQLHHFIAMITPMSLQPWSWQIFILI